MAHDRVVALGGLHILGTERHESRRIDNQLRGRAGRQGDPGSSQFFISMEDDLLRIFGGDPENKVHLLLDYTDHPHEIADPWYTRDFRKAEAEIDEGCAALLRTLRTQETA